MKNKILSLILSLFSIPLIAQYECVDYCHSFEDIICAHRLYIDTASTNLWQIGKADKVQIKGGFNSETSIVTDTLDSYPQNNISVFSIKNIATEGDLYGFKVFTGSYYVDTDSLNDFGSLEFSPDNGNLWIDLLNDTSYQSSIVWYSAPPVLTGRSGGWKHFDILLADNRSVFNLEYGDTIQYRFSFYSDSIFDDLDGLAFDNICFYEFVEGISQTKFTPIKSILYPNPTRDKCTIEFDNPNFLSYELAIYNIRSEPILRIENITGNTITFNTDDFVSDTYVYKLTNLSDRKRSWGKFIVAK